jgi:hypothetical protein
VCQQTRAISSGRRDDPELGQVSTNGIDRGLLADEQMAGAMQRQAGLLL